MKYKQALNIGTQAEGTIQCTYAVIYGSNKKPLFALQRKDFDSQTSYFDYKRNTGYDLNNTPEWDESDKQTSFLGAQQQFGDLNKFDVNVSSRNIFVYTGAGKEGILTWQSRGDGGLLENAPTGLIDFDLPLVAVEKYSSDTLVPAKLLYEAVEYIKKTISTAKKARKYEIWERDTRTGETRKLQEQYTEPDESTFKPKTGKEIYVQINEKGLEPRWQELIDRINNNSVVYVKPAAFRWEVTQLRNVDNLDVDADGTITAEKNGNVVEIDPESSLGKLAAAKAKLAQAEQNYKRAQAIVAAAGAISII